MIEDEELRILFQAESEERIKSLEQELGKLEVNFQDKEAIESAFRDAHSIKGVARILYIHSIEMIAHRLEENLDTFRKGTIAPNSEIIQTMYGAIYAIQALSHEAVTGKAADVNVPAILEALSLTGSKSEKSFALPPEKKTPNPTKALLEEKYIKEQLSPISTVRIDMQVINHLINETANLTVAKNRLTRLFERIEELLENYEKKNKIYSSSYFFSSNFILNQGKQKEGKKENTIFIKKIIDELREQEENIRSLCTDAHEDIHKLELIVSFFVDQIRKLSLLPLSKLFDFFPRMVRELSQAVGKEVELKIEGGEITVDKKIIEDMKDSFMHLLRNAISHGIEFPKEREQKGKPRKGLIQLVGKQAPRHILIEVIDDGKGLNTEEIKAIALQRQLISAKEAETLTPSEIQSFIFLSGFSTTQEVTDISGRGVGLDVVKNQVEKLNGTLKVTSFPNKGCCFSLQLPIVHATTHVILVQANKKIYALPMDMVESCFLISPEQISNIEGYDILPLQNQPISVNYLKNLIGTSVDQLHDEEKQVDVQPCIVIKTQDRKAVLLVDAILDEQTVIVTPPNRLLTHIPSIIGMTILKTGEVCLIVNPFNLIESTSKGLLSFQSQFKKKINKVKSKKTILLVDDSYIMRFILKRTLEEEGYYVVVAENGVEGLNKLKENQIDAVITDFEMPKMDGLTLITNIRAQANYYTLPIILLTTLSLQENKQKGLEAGANAYLIKSEQDQQSLLQTLKNLLYP